MASDTYKMKQVLSCFFSKMFSVRVIALGEDFCCHTVEFRGEEQKKLDVLSNDVFIKAHVSSGRTNALVSEENEEAIFVEASKRGRVLYEVFPMSFLMEQAGGQAFTGKKRALELVPEHIHDRSPIFLGSYDDVEEIKALYAAESV